MNKHLKKFTTFLNENEFHKIPEEAFSKILEEMKKSGRVAIDLYTNFPKLPEGFLNGLKKQAQKEGTTLEGILDDKIKQDPTLLYYLNDFPEIKQQVLDRTGEDDLSIVGFLLDK